MKKLSWLLRRQGCRRPRSLAPLGGRAAVSLWVTDDDLKRTEPTDENLEKIAKVTGVSVDWLKGESKEGGVTEKDVEEGSLRKNARRYQHSPFSLWRGAVIETVRSSNPLLIRHFDKKVHFPDTAQLHFDYLDSNLGAQFIYIEPNRSFVRANEVRSKLWELNVLKRMDEVIGVSREYWVFIATDEDHYQEMRDGIAEDYTSEYASEAYLLNIQWYVPSNADNAAKKILEIVDPIPF